MKNFPRLALSCPLALLVLGACATVDHTHEHSQGHPQEREASVRPANSFWNGADHIVRGTVVDASGAPIAAKVALVDANGSTSTRVSDGVFELGVYGDFPRTLCAWTPDGKIAWRVLQSPPGDRSVTMDVMEEGGTLTLIPGSYDDRISILTGGVPLHDVKFPAGEARTFVVPAGDIEFGTKGTDGHPADRRTLHVTPGAVTEVSF